jgi:transposase-like protein
MRTREMNSLKKMLQDLTSGQRRELRAELDQCEHRIQSVEIVEGQVDATSPCPHCGETDRVRHGASNGLQRYRCKACGRTFNALTGTPLAHLRKKGKWLGQMQALIDGLPLSQVSDRLNIAHSTAFRWRHRFLAAQKTLQAQHVAGIVEADQTYFLESGKGKRVEGRQARKRGGRSAKRGLSKEQVPVLVIRDRSGATASFRLEVDDAAHIVPLMKPRLARDAILCTDGSGVLASVARQLGVPHRPVNLSAGVRVIAGVFHVQNVNAFDARLKGWMARFKGVSTRYLDSYLGWFRTLDRSGLNSLKPTSFLASALAT